MAEKRFILTGPSEKLLKMELLKKHSLEGNLKPFNRIFYIEFKVALPLSLGRSLLVSKFLGQE